MKVRKILSIAVLSALLAACSSSGGGGGNNLQGGASSGGGGGGGGGGSSSTVGRAKIMDLNVIGPNVTLGGKTGEYDFSALPVPDDLIHLPMSMSYTTAQGTTATAYGSMAVYQQPYSVVMAEIWAQDSGDRFTNVIHLFSEGHVLGLATPLQARDKLREQNAIFDYTGVAYDGRTVGTLNYRMDFAQRQGSGSINGFSYLGHIDLWSATMTPDGFMRARATLEGEPGNNGVVYELSFFGPNAEEIAGKLRDTGNWQGGPRYLGDRVVIFAGKAE